MEGAGIILPPSPRPAPVPVVTTLIPLPPRTVGDGPPHMLELERPRDMHESLPDSEHPTHREDTTDQRPCAAGATQQHLQDTQDFIRLSRRNAQLASSFSAEHQRERATLQAPLMKLYVTLHPTSVYRWNDDFDVVLRAGHREHCSD